MDKPSLDSLHELTGDGTQTILSDAQSTGTVVFYRVDFILDTVLDTVYIQGVDHSSLFDTITLKAGTSIYNVTQVTVTTGLMIGFTAPFLT